MGLPLTLESQLCFALYSTLHAVEKAYTPLLSPLGLTYPQYLVMLVLWEGSRTTVKDIGGRLFLDSGTLTPLLKRLEAANLVTRSRAAGDERQVLVALTPKGQALRERAAPTPNAMACAMGEPAERIEALRDGLVRLRANLRVSNGSPAARPA